MGDVGVHSSRPGFYLLAGNNHCLVEVAQRHPLSYTLRSPDTGHCWCMTEGLAAMGKARANGKWFVSLKHDLSWLVIVKVSEKLSPADEIASLNSAPDEVILCAVRAGPIRCSGISTSAVELTVVQLEETWKTKQFVEVSTTKFGARIRGVNNVLVLRKASGARAFIVSATATRTGANGVNIHQVDEGNTLGPVSFILQDVPGNKSVSQMTESLFCVSCGSSHNIWDINNSTTPSPDWIVTHDQGAQVVAAGGLLFILTEPHGYSVEVRDPTTGRRLVTVSVSYVCAPSLESPLSFLI
ncbi:hypothetical protein Pelo_19365 [Pelomyxa schiedti]|nr:hypothetical protein Pelo_19365 [Pelomyxa schiedti]